MTASKLIAIGKYVAIAILILGIIHDVATFTPLIQEGMQCMPMDSIKAMTYMSLICGAFLILSGLLLTVLLKRIEEYPFLHLPILIIGIFLCINAILSVFYMFDNPFAWTGFILCFAMFGIILKLRQKIKTK